MQRRLAHRPLLPNLTDRPARAQHRVRLTQLGDDLVRGMSLAFRPLSLLARYSGSRVSHNHWINFLGAGQSEEGRVIRTWPLLAFNHGWDILGKNVGGFGAARGTFAVGSRRKGQVGQLPRAPCSS